MHDQSPQHLCRQGRRCKDSVAHPDGELVGAGVERPDSLCRACEQAAFDAVRELWGDYCQLACAITQPRGRVDDGPKITRTAERSIPIPLDVDTLMTAIDDEALRWAVRITRGDSLPTYPPLRVWRCVKILSANLGTLVDMPTGVVAAWFPYPDGGDWDGRKELDGVDAVLRLAQLHHRARSVLGLVDVTTWLAESCHVCGLRTLTVEVEQSTVKCRNCRQVWDQDEFARLSNPLLVA